MVKHKVFFIFDTLVPAYVTDQRRRRRHQVRRDDIATSGRAPLSPVGKGDLCCSHSVIILKGISSEPLTAVLDASLFSVTYNRLSRTGAHNHR